MVSKKKKKKIIKITTTKKPTEKQIQVSKLTNIKASFFLGLGSGKIPWANATSCP